MSYFTTAIGSALAITIRWVLPVLALAASAFPADVLERIAVSADGTGFVRQPSSRPFVVWGVNYDRDEASRLLEDYWEAEWATVVEDFAEMRALGANVVRIHLQLGRFMEAPDRPRTTALTQLTRLVRLAESTGVHLDVTGLGCYHKADIPAWYDPLPEEERWAVQARFWSAVAQVCVGSPAIFCYDLMNEPVVGGNPGDGWLAGALADKHYVQRIAIDLHGRAPTAIARAWIDRLTAAIRQHDRDHLITVGVIPWEMLFGPGAKPLFYDPAVATNLDFASVHFYPKAGEVDQALAALAHYDIGKPLVVEEIFPLNCSHDELADFIERSRVRADGWISFYWGRTIAELEREPASLAQGLKLHWFKRFRALGERLRVP